MIRLPDGMRDRIREAAEQNNRSMNAEIVARLEETFVARFSLEDFMSPEAKIEFLADQIKSLASILGEERGKQVNEKMKDYYDRMTKQDRQEPE